MTNDHREGGSSPLGRAAGAAALALAVVLAALVLRGGDPYTVVVELHNASTLVKGNLVQIDGRSVGTVRRVALSEDGIAEATIEVDDDVAPLREGTKAHLRVRSLTGSASRYIELEMPPGDRQATLEDGATIALSHTTTAVEVDHFLNMFDRRLRGGLRNVIRGQGAAYAGRRDEAAAAFHYLNPSLYQGQRLFRELTYDRYALQRFLRSNSRLWGDLAERRADVGRLVDRLAEMLDAIGRERSSLAQAIAQLPPFMRRANSTFVNLRATLDDLAPLVEESKPVAPKLRAVLANLRPFARDARPTFAALAEVLRRRGPNNDLLELQRAVPPFRDAALRPQRVNGKRRPGSFPTAIASLRGQTPQLAFQRPYVVDLTGWFDDFSHSGIYDANGSAGRIATSANAFALINGTLMPIREEERAATLGRFARLGQRNRCPGAMERPADDGSNPWRPSPDFNCDPTQVPPGR